MRLVQIPGLLLSALLLPGVSLAAPASATAPATAAGSRVNTLPGPVAAALQRAKVPQEALSAVVLPVEGDGTRLAWHGDVARNPASVMKLVTTYAALELLGPAFTWQTPVYVQGTLHGDTLTGKVYIRGQGDPKLVAERLWLMLRRLQGQGVKHIDGDIVLDRSAFSVAPRDPGDFDGEPWRPYNVAPDALLVNFNAVTLDFIPDRAAGIARIAIEPPLAAMQMPTSVPLAPEGTPCGDWRAGLQADFSQTGRIVLAGAYPLACGERPWSVAPADPQGYAARAVLGMWQRLGGTLTGAVRNGLVPEGLEPSFVARSPTLVEVIHDINKFSNNVMAQQMLLTLGWQQDGIATLAGAHAVLGDWWRAHGGTPDELVMDNGAGLSREGRVTALALARLLRQAWASPVMPELLASLPITGVDGTLKRRKGAARGATHLKTGTLRDATALAGYVRGASGRRYVLVALIHHPNAVAARPALDALVDWAWADR